MSLSLNPSTAVQNAAAMVAALTCLEFIREIPQCINGASTTRVLFIKFVIAVIVVLGILLIMFKFHEEPQIRPRSG